MGTHPIFESDFDCLTEKIMGLFGNKSFNKKKAPVRKTVSLNNLSQNPTVRAADLHPDPENTSFQIGGTTVQIKDGQILAAGGTSENDIQLKQENEQLRQMINKLRIEKELLLDMLAEITADFKTQKAI